MGYISQKPPCANEEDTVDQPTLTNQIPISENYEHFSNEEFIKRRKSSVVNNQTILNYLNMTENTDRELRDKIVKSIHDNLTLAIQYSKKNTAALLNNVLFEW